MVGRNRMRAIIILIYLFVSFTQAFSQEIKGKVVDESNQPLPFVSIIEENTQNGTQTDFDGNFYLKIKSNESLIVFYCLGFEEQKINANNNQFNIILKSKSVSMNEVEISAKKNNSSETILLMDKKNANGIESSIGSSEMTRKGISNAEDGLKKVSGISFTNSKLNIRGLDDRYNQVTLNGIPIPSNNADKKNIDLNILPVGIMDNMKIRKTYSSDQWGNVCGAQIDILTSEIKTIKSVSLRGSLNSLTPTPNYNFNFQIGKENKKLSYYLNLNLINDNQNLDGILRLINKQGNYVLDYKFKDRINQFTPSGIFVLHHESKNFSIKNTSLYINQKNTLYRETFGTHFDYSKDIFTTRNTPFSHSLFTDQINANYRLGNWTIDGIGGFSLVESGESAREQFVYLYDGQYSFNNIDKLDNHIFWNTNRENTINFNFTISHKGKKLDHYFGYSYLSSRNLFDYKQKYYDLGKINSIYGYIDPSNPNQYLNSDQTTELWVNNPASKTEGYTNINGFFIKSNFNSNKTDLSYGLRVEDVEQVVNYRDQLSPVFLKNNKIDNLDLLPFLSIKYRINDKKQLKFVASITNIRPRFRETVPFIYTEVFAGSKIQGNPNLTVSKVINFDLGYEFYPSNNQIYSIALFSKTIDNPIERVNIATASGRLETFQNSERSNVFGGEIEIKKRINKFIIDYNLSVLWSQIIISNEGNSTVVVSNLKRPLQGSSPILSNADLFYSINENNNIGITYNFIGKKLNAVGVFGLGDIYQIPQNFLNLIYNIEKNKYSISLRINNLLNAKYEFIQNSDSGYVVSNYYRLGQDFSVNLRYKF
jgi:outer membrane receptor protein involved in Fe transport